jgi:hypothetical protein
VEMAQVKAITMTRDHKETDPSLTALALSSQG